VQEEFKYCPYCKTKIKSKKIKNKEKKKEAKKNKKDA
jgi:hypothetical protein